MNVSRFTLSNGLRLVHLQDDSTEMVHVNLLYGVGAKNEEYEYTGIAHLLEHLLFEGTEKFPSFDEPLEAAGGDSNAYTNNDFTNYFISLPRRNAELAFCMEADRMCNISLDDEKVDVQRQVVMEEFKQGHLNKPYGDRHVGLAFAELIHDVMQLHGLGNECRLQKQVFRQSRPGSSPSRNRTRDRVTTMQKKRFV